MQARVVPVSAIEGVAWPDVGGAPLLSDPGLLSGDESGAAALNAAGQVVGTATNVNGEYRPCLWNGRGASDLGVLPGGRNGVGAGIDPHGRVVGWCHDDRHGDRAVLWWNGALIELGGLAERGESQALAINAAGLLVGNAQTARGERHACLWRAGQVTDLGALGGDGSAAYALNDAGLIVGMARDANGRGHATTWREGHAALALGSPVPGASRARGLNGAGVIVGSVMGGGRAATLSLGWGRWGVARPGTRLGGRRGDRDQRHRADRRRGPRQPGRAASLPLGGRGTARSQRPHRPGQRLAPRTRPRHRQQRPDRRSGSFPGPGARILVGSAARRGPCQRSGGQSRATAWRRYAALARGSPVAVGRARRIAP